MEITPSNLEAMSGYLQQTLSPDQDIRRNGMTSFKLFLDLQFSYSYSVNLIIFKLKGGCLHIDLGWSIIECPK